METLIQSDTLTKVLIKIICTFKSGQNIKISRSEEFHFGDWLPIFPHEMNQ